MEKIIFLEQIGGLMVEQVVRDHEYSMYSRHFHESYELYFLLRGERYYFIDRETYLVKEGMAVIVSRNQIHKTSMAGDSYHDRILLQMEEHWLAPLLERLGLPKPEQLFRRLNGVVEYTSRDWELLSGYLGRLKQEMKERREGAEVMIKLLVTQILVLTARNQGRDGSSEAETENGSFLVSDSYQARTAKHQKIREVTEYLLNHYASRESQEELAARFYVSKSYLCRIFKEVTGFTLNEYQNMARIKKAQELLTQTGDSVTEIAAQVGFETITYFERVFKKHTGERPLQYRKKYRTFCD